jgi:uncharacterized protein (TIGR00156 family)
MKKYIGFSTLALLLGLSLNATAQQGGYTGPSAVEPTSVAEALQKADDTVVEVTGKIEKSLGDEKYQFSDGTTSAVVEIDNEDFRGVTVNENDTVKLKGELDKDLLEAPVIDVDTIEKVQ